MKLIEERKAMVESFEKLNRNFKEWERNPSALVRAAIKKSLVDCYEHIQNLDHIDFDKSPVEETLEKIADPIPAAIQQPLIEEEKVAEKPIIEEKIEEPIAETKEEIVAPVVEEIKIAEEIIDIVEPEPIIVEKTEPTPIVEEKEIVEKPIVEFETPAHTNGVFLSSDDEVELEKYFQNQTIEESKIEESTPRFEMNVEEEIIDNITPEPIIEAKTEPTPIVEEKQETPSIDSFFNKERELPKNEPFEYVKPTETEKTRSSSFFSKSDEKKEAPTQLTLADKLALGHKDEGVHYDLKEKTITNINTAIPIAKKFEFIKELFGDNSENYKNAVESINNAANLQMANDLIENLADTFGWAAKADLAADFQKFVDRRFS